MKIALYVSAPVLLSFLMIFSTGSTSTPLVQATAGLYGNATLLPSIGSTIENVAGPHGMAHFYEVGDSANSTRVVIDLEGFEPGWHLTSMILAGNCQGSYVAALNAVTIDQFGRGQSTTILTGQQVSFGEWYVHVEFCDMLNPDQICAVCGKVDGVKPQVGSYKPGYGGATGSLPATGSSSAAFLEVFLILAMGLLLFAVGIYLRLTQTRHDQDNLSCPSAPEDQAVKNGLDK